MCFFFVRMTNCYHFERSLKNVRIRKGWCYFERYTKVCRLALCKFTNNEKLIKLNIKLEIKTNVIKYI